MSAAGAGAQEERDPNATHVLFLGNSGQEGVEARLQAALDSLRVAGGFPGATLGVAMPDGRVISLATGLSDTAARTPMRPQDRMLQGSVGKTYVAAVALQLVREGTLELDAPISRYLGEEPWFGRLPNARDITVRQLMNHTSGLVRYEFQPAVAERLRQEPFRVWTPADRLAYVLDLEPPFAAGQGWEYSDTNYIVLGMIIERLTGRPYYNELRRRVLYPHGLRNTIPSDNRDLPGVVVGYAGANNPLGGYNASLVNGRFAINPQFEWTGGGIASTTGELAHWAKLLYEGRVVDTSMVRLMVDGVPARLGGNARYGLGAIVRESPTLGPVWGHSGFFPGYATEMAYLPNTGVAVAIQVNSTAPYPRGLFPFLLRAAAIAAPPAPRTPVQRVSWLTGCWERTNGTRRAVEKWFPAIGGEMAGTAQSLSDAGARELERLRLFARGDTLVYEAKPARQALTQFASTRLGDSTLVFENPAHDFPRTITYTRVGADSLYARVEGDRAGQQRPLTFRFRRAECPTVMLPPTPPA